MLVLAVPKRHCDEGGPSSRNKCDDDGPSSSNRIGGRNAYVTTSKLVVLIYHVT